MKIRLATSRFTRSQANASWKANPGLAGFTATELLVVLAVVGVLAALLVATAGKALNTSRKMTGEIANFRTMGAALHGYLGEHNQVMPTNNIINRTLAHYLGLIGKITDWGTLENAGFNEPTHRLFISKYDDRPVPTRWDSYAENRYMGHDPKGEVDFETTGILRYNEIVNPSRKLFCLPAYFLKTYHPTFSASATRSPFIDPPHYTSYKSPFPALFVDGHVETVDPDPSRVGNTAYQIRREMIMPRYQ